MPLSALPLPGGVEFCNRDRGDFATRIDRFVSPMTRMLLSSEGLTTTLLWALLGQPVSVRCARNRRLPIASAPLGAAGLLGVVDGDVLVRRSMLATSDRVVSVNDVVARVDVSARAEQCVADVTAPLGEALHAAGTGYRRTVVDAGCQDWRMPPGGQAAFKTYVLWHGNQPLMTVHEVFSPRVVPSAVAHARCAAAGKVT
ncbi:hypothetical protein [Streptomyces roseifaciens]|uniref:hypothetical protein n=1 Tax=Streptomyces roseifaciens TaxID=1488406 RepID=UPI0007181E59|nr:hypothetical protein [Streptomyces roseifaciens]